MLLNPTDMATSQIIAEEMNNVPAAAVETAGKRVPPPTNRPQTVKASNLQLTSIVHDSNERLKFSATKLLPKLLTLRHADITRPLILSLHRE